MIKIVKLKRSNLLFLRTPLQQAIGMMFSKPKNLFFIFKKEKRLFVHNFFVFFPIDLIFLDKNYKVIEIKKNFLPFTIYLSKKKVKYLIEGRNLNYKLNEKNKFLG